MNKVDQLKDSALDGIPVFCAQTEEKNTNRKFFINFKSTNTVERPPVEIDEDQLKREISKPSPSLEMYKVPMIIGQIFWEKQHDITSEKSYVIDVHLNDNFAIRKVLISELIRHFVVIVTLATIEEKYNSIHSRKICGQFIGHDLRLDNNYFKVLDLTQSKDKSTELVNNKIILIDENLNQSVNNEKDNNLDLFYRPGSRILTCSLNTDKLPNTISYNDDRIVIECDGKSLIDTVLPFYIDLNEPMRYKFDDKLCLFRAVFKISESMRHSP